VTGLLHAGENCNPACRLDVGYGGDCPHFCGPAGQCCQRIDWYRGVPGCELAENVTTHAVCGLWKQPHPLPPDFRVPLPLGMHPTPPESTAPARDEIGGALRWLRDLQNVTGAAPADHSRPAYAGSGGQPWSPFEMGLVRELILRETRRATAGRDAISGARMLRLAFHDCLRHVGGGGGCDGCLNWQGVGAVLGGDNGRVEDREEEDHERRLDNNGLQETVQFLEHVYTMDLGQTWASGCWQTPSTISGAPFLAGPITVNSTEECQRVCRETVGCAQFTVPTIPFIDSTGPCRLFGEGGRWRHLSTGRLVAGRAHCEANTTSWSLRNTNKSRADLWAFASLLAVEEGIDRHNWACDGDRRGPFNGPIQCVQFEGEPGCKITPSRPFYFQTGRRDCVTSLTPSYMADEHEYHPDEHFNGTMVVQFMESQFGFNARETIAIMGAHTMGRFHQKQTAHKYVWTTDFQAFNNQYYRNVVGKPDWFFDDDACTRVGDAWGNKGQAVWIGKMNQRFRTGAPIQWIQKKVACPNCVARSYERGGRHPDRLAQDRDCCLNNVPSGAQCRPDGVGPEGSTTLMRDDDASDGCEYSHFIFGKDETALSVDMGLYYAFDVDVRGFPSGCPGLDTFFPSSDRFSDFTCGIDGRPWFVDPSLSFDHPNLTRRTRTDWTQRACPMDCPLQSYRYPGDDRTIADHFLRFADDQGAWIEAFLPAMEKMLANGYQSIDVAGSPQSELIVSWPLVPSPPSSDAPSQTSTDDLAVPSTPPTTTEAVVTPGGAQHIVRGSLTMTMAAIGNLESEASMNAMKAAIASQAGVDQDAVASVELAVKVIGQMPMQVSDPAAFVQSAEVRAGVEAAIADQIGVDPSDVTATLSTARRLERRRLQSNVHVDFEIAAADGSAADSRAEAMSLASTADLTAAIGAELAATNLEVMVIEAVTAVPQVSVIYAIVTADASVAEAASAAVTAAGPAAMTASMNTELQGAGVQVEVTVSEVAAPTLESGASNIPAAGVSNTGSFSSPTASQCASARLLAAVAVLFVTDALGTLS